MLPVSPQLQDSEGTHRAAKHEDAQRRSQSCRRREPPATRASLTQSAKDLVVKAGDTPKETIAEAKKRLDLAGVRCLGLVLNQRTDPIPGLVYRMT